MVFGFRQMSRNFMDFSLKNHAQLSFPDFNGKKKGVFQILFDP